MTQLLKKLGFVNEQLISITDITQSCIANHLEYLNKLRQLLHDQKLNDDLIYDLITSFKATPTSPNDDLNPLANTNLYSAHQEICFHRKCYDVLFHFG